MFGPALVIALALIAPFAMAAFRFAYALGDRDGRWRTSAILFGSTLALCLLAFLVGAVPLIGLFAGVWLSAFISFGLLNRCTRRSLLIGNTMALCFVLPSSLVLFGHLSLLETRGIDLDYFTGSADQLAVVQLLAAASLLIGCVFILVLARTLGGTYPATEQGDRALRQFHMFAAFGMIYELLDLVPLSLNTKFPFMPYFLFGGSVLLLLFFAVFTLSTTYLGAEAFRELENIDLERRRRDEMVRMKLYQHEATIDPLTNLNVRRVGREHLSRLDKTRMPYLMAFLDVDGLKDINDAFGHAVGDECLKAFAQALAKTFPDDHVIRWGGDEFVVLTESDDIDAFEANLDALDAQFVTPDGTRPDQFCYGTASSALGDSDTVLRHADEAMYCRKQAGRTPACGGEVQ